MFYVLLVMFVGIGAGYVVRERSGVKTTVDRVIMPTIYLLLLAMGITVGSNKEVMNNLHILGFEALVITIGAVIGSICTGWIVWLKFFRPKQQDEQ